MKEPDLEGLLENDEAEVAIGYKRPLDDVELLLEEMPEDDRYVVLDIFGNYTLDRLEDIADETIGRDYLYGVKSRLPEERDTGHYRLVDDLQDLEGRIEAVSNVVVRGVMKNDPAPDILYVLDDVNSALGFNEEEELFRYAHTLTGNFMALEADSVIMANEGYDGMLVNLASTEIDLTVST